MCKGTKPSLLAPAVSLIEMHSHSWLFRELPRSDIFRPVHLFGGKQINCRVMVIPGGAKKRPEHSHAVYSRVVEMNQHKSTYVMIKHFRICLGILA